MHSDNTEEPKTKKAKTVALAVELDGRYTVHTISDYGGPIKKRSDGQTEISGGKTHRVDSTGCEWNSTFEWLDDDKKTVLMTSIADPLNADDDFLLIRPDGTPTSDKVIYESTLKVMRKDGRLQMTGSINYGSETIIVTLRKNNDS